MKTLASVLIGSILLSQTPAVHAATLYETVKRQMDLELRDEKVDDEVKNFIEAIAKERKWEIKADEVDSIIAGSTDVCSKHEALNGLGCLDVLNEIRTIVSFENEVRMAGRRLQAIATGYELPISEIPRKTQTLFGDLNTIVNVWKAGTQSTGQAATKTIPTVAIEEKEGKNMESLVENLADKLQELKGDERIAAVWRYQYGERLVREKRKPSFLAPDVQETLRDDKGNEIKCEEGERKFLCKRWEDVENALDAIWTELLAQYQERKDMPPTYYLIFPEDVTKALPDNVIVWARMDADPTHPSGDVGLQWTTPLDPVFPTLTNDGKAILGGEYPPEPPKKQEQNTKVRLELERAGELDAGSGLCSMAFALKGYLCRPLEVTSAEGCPDAEEQDKDSIVLVSCKTQSFLKQTVAGPDVCSEIAWNQGQSSSAGSAGAASSSSSSLNPYCGCTYEVTCQSDCEGGLGGATYPKDGSNTIRVCIDTSPYIQTPEDLLAHEMTHVRQLCGKPAGQSSNTKEICCGSEYDAYLVNCNAAETRGQLAPLGISVSRCAEMLANRSCSTFGANVCTTATNAEQDALTKALQTPHGGTCPVPESERKKEINMCPCTPGTLSGYGNTIGNNLCFIGQCVEQSLETHRVTPGRAPIGVQDEAFPYDDPLAGSPLGNFLTAPTTGQPILPPYNPMIPVREFESALCALSGLPAGAPAALCTIDANRRTDSPLTDPLSTLMSMFQMETNHELSVQEMESLAQSVGTRLGTDLYARNMRMASKNLADVIGIATKLLNEIKSIDFPDKMCAMGQDSAATPATPEE